MLQHGDHGYGAIVDKGVQVPSVFLEAADVYRPQGVGTIHADFIGSESHHGTVLFVKSKKSADSGTGLPFGADP